MARLVHVLSRFPANELAVHRLYVHDDGFRAVCDDYEESLAALRRWEAVDAARAEDFRHLAAEIEAEIAAYLKRPARDDPGG